MNRQKKSILGTAARAIGVSAIVGFAGSMAFAELLDQQLEFPLLAYNNQGTVTFTGNSGEFVVDASPLAISVSEGQPPIFINPTGDPATEVVFINVVVSALGDLIGGAPGDDFTVVGELDLGADGFFAGTLLTGEVVAFGFEDSGGPTDLYNFEVQVTGGELSTVPGLPGYAVGRSIGVELTSENSGFTGDFKVDFEGDAKGTIGALPGSEDCVINVVKTCKILDDDGGDDGDKDKDKDKDDDRTSARDGDDDDKDKDVDDGDSVDVKYTYAVTNKGMLPITNVMVEDDQLDVPDSPIAQIMPGETIELMATAHITETTTNIVTVMGTTGVESCEAMDSATVRFLTDDDDDGDKDKDKDKDKDDDYSAFNSSATDGDKDKDKDKDDDMDPPVDDHPPTSECIVGDDGGDDGDKDKDKDKDDDADDGYEHTPRPWWCRFMQSAPACN